MQQEQERQQDVPDYTLRTINATVQAVLARNGIACREMAQRYPGGGMLPPGSVPRITIGDRVITYYYRLVQPEAWKAAEGLGVAMGMQLASVLRVGHTRLVPTIFPEGEYLAVQVPRHKPALVVWEDLAELDASAIILGRDTKRRLVKVDLLDYAPSFKVVGASGSGKTNALRSIAAQAALLGWGVAIACMKGARDWVDLAPLATLGTAWDNTKGAALIAKIDSIRQQREAGASDRTPVLLVWDEIAKPATTRENQEALGSLISQCRSAKIMVLWGSQVVGPAIHPQIRDNAVSGLVGQVASASASYQASNVNGLNAHRLGGLGDMFLIEEAGATVTRLQTPRADPQQKRIEAGEQAGDLDKLIESALTAQNAPESFLSTTTAPPPDKQQEDPPALASVEVIEGPTLAQMALAAFEQDKLEDRRRIPPPLALVGRIACYCWRYGRLPPIALEQDWLAYLGHREAMQRWLAGEGKTPPQEKRYHMAARRLELARAIAWDYYTRLGQIQQTWQQTHNPLVDASPVGGFLAEQAR